jgi:hypothetical protein
MLESLSHFFRSLVSLHNPLWLFYPLLAVIAVVYKATKFDRPKDIALASIHFFGSVALGMLALGLAFYLVSILF